jgi:hypothetical protein
MADGKTMESDRLQQAITLIKKGKREQARELILSEVKSNPENLTAWLWALEVAANEKEQRTILHRILTLDPTHKGALQFLKKLDQAPLNQDDPEEAAKPDDKSPQSPNQPVLSRLGALLRFVLDWLFSLPASCGFLALFLIILLGIFIYFRMNTSFFGLAGADFDKLVISNSYEKISSDEIYWEVQFEGTGESKYIGTVRYAAPIRIKEFSILTHDILVTTADFANPDIIDTNVIDHKFFWKSTSASSPNGSINLIHAIPANKEVYQIMLEIQKWDTVKITGREIYSVKAYQSDGTFLGTWQDMGCNTLLVESVSLLKADTDQ